MSHLDSGKMTCIFCDNENSAKSVEHIVSESYGNKDYVMEKGKVCDDCNSNYTSRRELFDAHNFSELNANLTSKTNTDWTFMTTDFELSRFESVPQYTNKHRLNKIRCKWGLRFGENRNAYFMLNRKQLVPSTRERKNFRIILEEDSDGRFYFGKKDQKIEAIPNNCQNLASLLK